MCFIGRYRGRDAKRRLPIGTLACVRVCAYRNGTFGNVPNERIYMFYFAFILFESHLK